MNQVTPFLNRINASESIFSFKMGLMIVIKSASIFLRVLIFDGALPEIFQVKQWSFLFSRCAAVFDLIEGLLCSS